MHYLGRYVSSTQTLHSSLRSHTPHTFAYIQGRAKVTVQLILLHNTKHLYTIVTTAPPYVSITHIFIYQMQKILNPYQKEDGLEPKTYMLFHIFTFHFLSFFKFTKKNLLWLSQRLFSSHSYATEETATIKSKILKHWNRKAF